MARPVESQSVFSLKDNLSFWIFQNTIGHLAPRVAADRNLAPFDTAAILARSFSVQFTGAAGGLKRCTPIYSPSAAFGSVPTVRPIFMLRTVCPRELPTMHKIHLKWRLQCFARIFFEIPFLSCRVFSVSNLLVAYIECSGPRPSLTSWIPKWDSVYCSRLAVFPARASFSLNM